MVSQTVVRWTGAGNDGLWSNARNWSDEKVPDQTKYAIVEGEGEVHIDIDANPYQLQVIDKATLIIDRFKSLTIDGGMVANNFEFVGVRTSAALVVNGSLVVNNVIGNGIRVYDSASLKAQDCEEIRLQDVTGNALRNDGETDLGLTSMFFISNVAILNFGTLTLARELIVQDLVFSSAWGVNNYGVFNNSSSGTINLRGQLGGLSSIINQVGAAFYNYGALNISDMETVAIHNIGTFNNYEQISIDNVTENFILNGGIWNNEPTSSIIINDATSPTKPTIHNLGGVFNNFGDIRMTDMQYIGLRNEGTFNNNNLLQIDSTKTSAAIRNHGTLTNSHHINISNVNYLGGAYPYALLNEESGVINNTDNIFFSFLNADGIYNQGSFTSSSAASNISMFYTLGDLFINDAGATFEVNTLHLSRIF